MPEPDSLAQALERLDEVTRRLRVECPWDREQDARSIVPHTVEEAYELAEAARNGDDEAMRDELGDVLFQVVFLSLLLEERGEGDLAAVATQLTEKLIRRHPHVYPPEDAGETEIETADDVRRQWDEIKSGVEGRTAEKDWKKPGIPALIYANKIQWKLDRKEKPANVGAGFPDRSAHEAEVGRLLWQAVETARSRGIDPELALRAEAERRASELNDR
ncbi:MAG: nucleoside triphosphate pyrophosphohydrolase [Thermoleophilia bacterium]|nr:nucleoside triphosphate pyrophosphohydrolase [Thermoleophilia bacterium]